VIRTNVIWCGVFCDSTLGGESNDQGHANVTVTSWVFLRKVIILSVSEG